MRLANLSYYSRIIAFFRTDCSPDALLRWGVLFGLLFVHSKIFADETVESDFPYTAYVSQDRTRLLSGPADDHYATEELRRGVPVEVYRRAEGGWLAVRPPDSSFSWVSQRDIKLTDESDVGEVIGTASVSWIGSNIEEVADHRWLVKLERGENVVILGKERRRMIDSEKSEVYYKIAPPAGEFRWIHEDELVRDQTQIDAIKDPKVQLADFRVALRGKPLPMSDEDTKTEEKSVDRKSLDNDDNHKTAKLVRSNPSVESQEAKKDGFSAREKSSTTSGKANGLALLPKRGAKLSTKESTSTNLDSLEKSVTPDLEARLRELDAQLSVVVSQPAESWDFAALRVGAEQLATKGQSTLDRARVQLFLDKLAEFEGLKSRYALMAPKPPVTGPLPKLTTSGSSASFGAKSNSETGRDPRFDGIGWLLPVHSSKRSSPPFALLDKDGNILQFVSPAPGLNLNRYLRKEIGVFGQKDQPTTLDKPHLTAHRIVELDRHRK